MSDINQLMSDSNHQHQVDIFASDQRQRHFAELCNALYERELQALSKNSISNVSLLQRRLAGLSYHIKNAADYFLTQEAPIDVDIHNGSWQAKQAAKSVITRHQANKCQDWLGKHARMGLPVPVFISDMGLETVELDSIDRIDSERKRLHVNKHGWFQFDGQELTSEPKVHCQKTLLLPNKLNITAACCGHSWNHKGRTIPRALSLRELLLATTINWKTYK
ncbi:hypothetical protein [Aliiglaciecola sp. LCG003]|uniref:hypothetical protein n=1 Tax=Aliiglaciecola sp. LCG003 TaxID=3053655 RepID=UPI0025745298|nr:hypothetical protein [Aliiglaciecola sp. LCG003]WJG08612.1 hypothetical protein QR722_14885 [Aliiglaciecola sp. LCG003]